MKKYIITGGASSGKSTLLAELGARGLYTVEEAAKEIILHKQQKGVGEPWLEHDFQDKILDLQIEKEAKIPVDTEIALIDRGLHDSLAYYHYRDQEIPKKLLENILKCDYEKIFFLEPLKFFEKGKYRFEKGMNEAVRIAELIKKTYLNMGYEVIMIPPFSVKERADMVLEYIRKYT